MKNPITKRRLVTFGIAIIVLAVAGFFVFFPPGPRPLCHRAIDGAMMQWSLENGRTNAGPNANGKSSASLAMVEPYFDDRLQQYGYVPGLRFTDPGDLV